jgi:hypothetical protein
MLAAMNPFKETRSCRNCGAPFECYVKSTTRNCSHECGSIARKNAHHMIHTSEYSAWRDMKARCYRLTHKDYPRYGGRGIMVCDSWRNSFQTFYADMGAKPDPKLTIERKDNNGNYEPTNCKWADKFEQNRNRSGNWSAEEDQALRNAAERGLSFPEIASLLGKSLAATQGHAYRIGVKSGRPPTRRDYACPQIALHDRH